jgi:ankyrin repeat protein
MPIHRAAIRGYCEVVVQLLKSGIDPNVGDYEGYTPLHFAAKSGHYDTCEALYRSGGEPLRSNSLAFTALDFAQRYGFEDLVALFNTPRSRLPAAGTIGDRPEQRLSMGDPRGRASVSHEVGESS